MTYNFPWVRWPDHQDLMHAFPDPSAVRFVGGAVRNTLLGLMPDDFDLATSYRPEEVRSFLAPQGIKVIPTGLAHGTVTALFKDKAYEITTLRRDTETDGRHATVVYTSSWQQDALRRDFTMNALYVDQEGQLYDEVGGTSDALEGYVRFIGDPFQRIHEDYLRILRFFRFWAFYGRHGDEQGLQAACTLKEKMSALSGERITKEFLKILTASTMWPVMDVLYHKGFLPFILGHSPHAPVFEALREIESVVGPVSPFVRLASVSTDIPSRLVLSRHQKEELKKLLAPFDYSCLLESLHETSPEITKGRIILHACHLLQQGKPDVISTLQGVLSDLEHKSWPSFPLMGRDLIELGLEGPSVGKLLKKAKDYWLSYGGVHTHQQCVEYVKGCLNTPIL
jgi:poly(A) polymerase